MRTRSSRPASLCGRLRTWGWRRRGCIRIRTGPPTSRVRPACCWSQRGNESARAKQLHRRIAFHQVEEHPRRLAARALQPAVAVDEEPGVVARRLRQLGYLLGRGEAELRLARLLRSEDLAGAPQPQILLGDSEAVVRLAHQGQARSAGFAQRVAAKQEADRPGLPPPDPAAQLVELGEAEA